MSIQVANIDLSAAVVGTTGKIPFGQATPPPTITQQMRPQSTPGYTLVIQNDTGCGLTCLFPATNKSLTIRAGDGRQVHVPPGESELDYTVIYVLANAPVSRLLADLYIPGEAVDSVGNLGNSPIGLSGPVATIGTTLQTTNNQSCEFNTFDTGALVNLTPVAPSGQARGLHMVTEDATGTYHAGFQVDANGATFATKVFSLAGQATAGSFGVTGIVAQALRVGVAVTTVQTILSFSIPANGTYRISYVLQTHNGTAGWKPMCKVSYTDADGVADVAFPMGQDGNGNAHIFDGIGTSLASSAGDYELPVVPLTQDCNVGTLTCQYQATGTPNDKITVIVERLA